MDNLFGNYISKKFTDIFDSYETFYEEYNDCQLPKLLSTTSIQTLFYLLYANYGNSHISNADETQFKYRLFAIIWQYGPAWEKKLDIQSKIRNLTDDELVYGTKQIHNHSFNPSTEPSTSTLTELETINEQNTSTVKRGKLEAYNYVWDLLATDVTKEFLNRFRALFLTVVEPQRPLWYVSDEEN